MNFQNGLVETQCGVGEAEAIPKCLVIPVGTEQVGMSLLPLQLSYSLVTCFDY